MFLSTPCTLGHPLGASFCGGIWAFYGRSWPSTNPSRSNCPFSAPGRARFDSGVSKVDFRSSGASCVVSERNLPILQACPAPQLRSIMQICRAPSALPRFSRLGQSMPRRCRVFAMTNIRPDDTGLPMVIFVSRGLGIRHGPRIKVSTCYGRSTSSNGGSGESRPDDPARIRFPMMRIGVL